MSRDDVRAVVDAGRVPPPGPPAGLFVGFFMVRVKLSGGSDGTSSTPCTYVYDLFPPRAADGADPFDIATRVAVNKRPRCGRAAGDIGMYTPAPDGSIGFAYKDPNAQTGDDGVRLALCEESVTTGVCEVPAP